MAGIVGTVQPSHTVSNLTLAVALPQAATAGNLIRILVACHAGTSATSSPTITTPSGWSRVGSTSTTSSTNDKTTFGVYYKTAAGGETSVSFTVTDGLGGISALAWEFAGSTGILDQNGVASLGAASSAGRTDTSGTITQTAGLDDVVAVHVLLSATASGAPSNTWLNGFTSIANDPFTNGLSLSIATQQTLANSAISPSVTWTTGALCQAELTKGFSFALTPIASGQVSISGSANDGATDTASGAISISGSASAAVQASAGGSVSVAGASGASVATSAAGSISIDGTVALSASDTASGSVSISGVSSATAPIGLSGSVSISSSASVSPVLTPQGSVSISGTALARAAMSPGGSVSIVGVSVASPDVSVSGSVSIAGAAIARVSGMASGDVQIDGSSSASARALASGSVSISGTAIIAIGPHRDISLVLTTARPRWIVSTAEPRWVIVTARPRWAIATKEQP